MLGRESKGLAILKVDGKSSKVALSNKPVPLALDRRGLPLHPHGNLSVPMNRKKSGSGIPGCSKGWFCWGSCGRLAGYFVIIVAIFGLQGTCPMEGGRSSSQSTGISYE